MISRQEAIAKLRDLVLSLGNIPSIPGCANSLECPGHGTCAAAQATQSELNGLGLTNLGIFFVGNITRVIPGIHRCPNREKIETVVNASIAAAKTIPPR